ncbi:Uncharacterised protein [Mycoplasmopsis californica]|uniref:Transglutaminase-like domain-containing protein n=1 Tax=Mycoplasmopsis equigenitalium TaxID=114883 RepID=A0ABY5J5K7_9BACT|nr:transglutaminase domain-containing protein [Mycoplasmopsis equigenitalium]UUD36968.1 hypothetical protein NPA09_00075 [Mycoplasmopsis equigenitalium]VEU69737.1 Uncharacterised protein [Mycoplasmopsis californica]
MKLKRLALFGLCAALAPITLSASGCNLLSNIRYIKEPEKEVEKIPSEEPNYSFKNKVIEYYQVTPEENEQDKKITTDLISKIVGDLDVDLSSVEKKWNNKSNQFKVAKKLKTVRDKLLEITPLVYDNMGLREGRFRANLIRYENFVNNYLTSYFIKPKKTNYVIKYFIQQFNNDKTHFITMCDMNEEYINNHLDEILTYLDGVERDLALTFDKEDALIIDEEYLSNLNFLTHIYSTNYAVRNKIKEFRQKLLYTGVGHINDVIVSKTDAKDFPNVIQDIIYDFTGGSNYFNDITSVSVIHKNQGGKYLLSINGPLDYRTNTPEEQIAVNELIIAVIPNIISKKMTDRQKIEAVHNWITTATEYAEKDEINNNDLEDEIRSTYRFVTKEKVVCEGYARMFSKFMLFLNIDTWYITGKTYSERWDRWSNHAWNMVKIDGEYLFVDVTWDDPSLNPTIDVDSIHHKSITAYSRKYLLKDWDTFSEKGTARKIDDSYYSFKKYRDSKDKPYISLPNKE